MEHSSSLNHERSAFGNDLVLFLFGVSGLELISSYLPVVVQNMENYVPIIKRFSGELCFRIKNKYLYHMVIRLLSMLLAKLQSSIKFPKAQTPLHTKDIK